MPEKSDVVLYVCRRWVKFVVNAFKRRKWGAQVMRARNGGGCDRLHPFGVIANRAGIGLARTRGITVPRAHFSCDIGVLSDWGHTSI